MEMIKSGSPMLSVDIDGTIFILRVAAICVEDNRLLICKPPELDFWYTPGGRVQVGETLFEALDREMLEETGALPESAELVWITENFFAHGEQPFHEVGIYFRVTLPRDAAALSWHGVTTRIETGDENELEWKWVPIGDLASLDLSPPFLAERLKTSPTGITHIVHRRD